VQTQEHIISAKEEITLR